MDVRNDISLFTILNSEIYISRKPNNNNNGPHIFVRTFFPSLQWHLAHLFQQLSHNIHLHFFFNNLLLHRSAVDFALMTLHVYIHADYAIHTAWRSFHQMCALYTRAHVRLRKITVNRDINARGLPFFSSFSSFLIFLSLFLSYIQYSFA